MTNIGYYKCRVYSNARKIIGPASIEPVYNYSFNQKECERYVNNIHITERSFKNSADSYI